MPRRWRVSARTLLFIVVLVMLGLNILIAQILQQTVLKRRSGAADVDWTPALIEQCRKLGVNSAVNMDGLSLGQVNVSIETGMHWYEGLLSTDDFGDATVDYQFNDSASGYTVVISDTPEVSIVDQDQTVGGTYTITAPPTGNLPNAGIFDNALLLIIVGTGLIGAGAISFYNQNRFEREITQSYLE